MTSTARLVAVLLFGVLGIGALSSGASAHSDLLRSNPRPDETVSRSVSAITLVFASPVDPALTDVVVTGKNGNEDVGEPVVRDSVVTVPLGPLDTAGRYTVSYRVVAVDGHPVTGSYRFTVPREAVLAADGRSQTPPVALSTNVAIAGAPLGDRDVTVPWWLDLGPELLLVLAVLAVVGTSLVRRARLREESRRG